MAFEAKTTPPRNSLRISDLENDMYVTLQIYNIIWNKVIIYPTSAFSYFISFILLFENFDFAGLILQKVHNVIKFKQKAFAKDFLQLTTQNRAVATTRSEKGNFIKSQ